MEEHPGCPVPHDVKDPEPVTFTVHSSHGNGVVPTPARHDRPWFEEHYKTKDHARFCLPLLMANQLGFSLPSPVEAVINWSGEGEPQIDMRQGDRNRITTHSANGSFTIQLNVVFRSPPDWLFLIKCVPNVRKPYAVMEGLIEGWLNVANFGLVCLFDHPGFAHIKLGEPIAHMVPISADALTVRLEPGCLAEELPLRREYDLRRVRPGYKRDLDYFKGRLPTGEKVCPHYTPRSAAD